MAQHSSRGKVVVQLPGTAPPQEVRERYALELEMLDALGVELVEAPARDPETLVAAASDADAIITSWGVAFTREIIAQLQRCRIIGVGSVGVDMVDVAAATEHGIVVTNVPDVFIEEVADHALMLLLAAGRRSKQMDQLVRAGAWFDGRSVLSRLPRLWGQTLGLAGFGNVATAVARRAQPFGLHVIAFDPYVSELKLTAEGVEPVAFGELLERPDYLSLHTPLNRETHHLFDRRAFERMQPTAVLVNTARGPIVDETALIDALAQGSIAAAGLDVLETEPPAADNPLLTMDNVIVTPHVASATTRMRPETRRRVAREVALVLRGLWPRNAVNPDVLPRTGLERWQPYPTQRGPNR